MLDAFAKIVVAPNRFEAFKEWRQTLAAALPFCHQRLSTLTVRPERRALTARLCRRPVDQAGRSARAIVAQIKFRAFTWLATESL
jgi:hypothetical protein